MGGGGVAAVGMLLFARIVADSVVIEEGYLVKSDAVLSGRRLQTLEEELTASNFKVEEEDRQETNKKQAQAELFDLEAGCSTFLRNVGEILPVYTTLHSRI
jgi:hypothetical protein